MKCDRLPSALLLLSLVLSSTLTNALPQNEFSFNRRAITGSSAELADTDASSPKVVARGTLDAPVDGKDGKPHAGPWVETNADRDRKKAKEMDGTVKVTKLDTQTMNRLGSGVSLPDSNDGVMDDPNRLGPKDGTRGTEGGVSEKSKGTNLVTEKFPETPKEAPPLPHSEQEKLPVTQDTPADTVGKDKLLEKPADLPDRPHDIPPPKSPAPVSDDPLNLKSENTKSSGNKPVSGSRQEITTHEDKVINPFHSLFLSFTMILVSEIGDKTFLVAALMAMRHPRLLVFSAAFSALFVMTVLSALLGHAVPTLIPARFTKFLAAALFLVFGLNMLREGRAMSPDEGVSEEMKEVEMELEEKEQEQRRRNRRDSSISPYALEAGRAGRKSRPSTNRLPSPPASVSSSSSRESSPSRRSTWQNLFVGFNNLVSLLLSPAWVQTFVMTFLGEWGDRSQIATIAMAAGQDYWWVMVGAVIGHSMCTAAAVIGGRAIAGRVSLRVVTLGGATAFLVFALIYLIEVFA